MAKPEENHGKSHGNREKLAEFRIWISFGIFWIYFYHDLINTDEFWAMLLEDVADSPIIAFPASLKDFNTSFDILN